MILVVLQLRCSIIPFRGIPASLAAEIAQVERGDETIVPRFADPCRRQRTEEAHLFASNADAEDNFGSSIGVTADGNTLIVGAPGEASVSTNPSDNSAAGAGAAYVFTHGTAWGQAAYLKASNPEAVDNNGTSAAISGDGKTMATGAPGESSASSGVNGDENNDAISSSGATYVQVVQ